MYIHEVHYKILREQLEKNERLIKKQERIIESLTLHTEILQERIERTINEE